MGGGPHRGRELACNWRYRLAAQAIGTCQKYGKQRKLRTAVNWDIMDIDGPRSVADWGGGGVPHRGHELARNLQYILTAEPTMHGKQTRLRTAEQCGGVGSGGCTCKQSTASKASSELLRTVTRWATHCHRVDKECGGVGGGGRWASSRAGAGTNSLQ